LTLHGPRVLALIGDYDGCSWWRVSRPFERLAEQGYFAAYANKDEPGLERIAHLYDAVLLPRLSWSDHRIGERFIGALHRAGLCVIYEVDDDLFSEHVNARLKQTTMPGELPSDLERKRLDRLAALRLCDGVTVSSRRLQTVTAGLVDAPVVCVPNAIDTRWWRDAVRGAPRYFPGLTIGWAGGARPDADLLTVAEAWGRIARRYPDVTFISLGYQPAILSEYVPEARLRRIPWQPLAALPQALKQIDLACCSVVDAPFNRCKTPIKVWEATLSGSAVVATPTLYRQAVTDGVDGLLAETADEWEAALVRLIDSPEERRRLRKAQRRRVATEHSLDNNLWRWPAAWTQIINDFRAKQRQPRLYLPVGA
jgi:glycosyltransferase involved in cell wall biosynthesis